MATFSIERTSRSSDDAGGSVGSSGEKHKHPGDNRSQEQRMEDEEKKAAEAGPFKASTWAWLIIFVVAAFFVWYVALR